MLQPVCTVQKVWIFHFGLFHLTLACMGSVEEFIENVRLSVQSPLSKYHPIIF